MRGPLSYYGLVFVHIVDHQNTQLHDTMKPTIQNDANNPGSRGIPPTANNCGTTTNVVHSVGIQVTIEISEI